MHNGFILGLTGQSGAGKSTVCRLLIQNCPRGIAFIDCDRVARMVVEPGTECLAELVQRFSGMVEGSLLLPDGTLDRRKLGGAVFGDAERLRLLNSTMFPHILAEIERQTLTLARGKRMVVLDAPTLFESGADRMCQRIVSVTAPQELRIQRICRRDGITREAARQRLSSQHKNHYYISRSDFVLCNSRDEPYIQAQLEELLYRLGMCSGWPRKGWVERQGLRRLLGRRVYRGKRTGADREVE